MTTINVELPVIWQAEIQQQIYRSLLTAFSYPGRVQDVPIDGSEWDAVAASLATMVDGQVGFYVEPGLQGDQFIRFMAGQQVAFTEADWIACDGRHEAPTALPKLGTLEEPELNATMLVLVEGFAGDAGTSLTLEGPGIKDQHKLSIQGLHPSWLNARAQWCQKFPQGVDIIFCAASQLCALPRTTQIVEEP